ncbi:MAG: DNA topoisomerase, partial [candidate division Zixibacteria bacterium]|nr:DNA topoisomerase [candidate division Zixibacteria bacterium]
QISVSIAAGDKYFFKSTGRRNIFPGFAAVFETIKQAKAAKSENGGESSEEEPEITGDLPDLQAGEALTLHELLGEQHFTKPPARFNDASLVKALEEEGIGRPSTYAPIIYTLVARDYVQRQGGALQPTELGDMVVDLLVKHFANILDARFTASMEEELDKIEDGQLDWVSVIRDFYGPFEADVKVAREEMKNIKRHVVPTEYTCDVCGKGMVIKWGRFGKFLACTGFPECRYTRSIPTGFRCPEPGCGGDLVKRMSKKKRTFYGCSNYPKCHHVVNKLPKKDETVNDDDKVSDLDRETFQP